jgi:uncharacterized protein YndB with AHSA1/START domain
MRVEESVEINRSPEEVFDYVANPQNLPEWSGLAIEVKDAPEPLEEGDKFTAVGKFLGRRFETPYERISIEPNRRYTDRAAGGPVPDQDWIYEPGAFFKLAEPLIERVLRRQVRADLETLKDLLEARG